MTDEFDDDELGPMLQRALRALPEARPIPDLARRAMALAKQSEAADAQLAHGRRQLIRRQRWQLLATCAAVVLVSLIVLLGLNSLPISVWSMLWSHESYEWSLSSTATYEGSFSIPLLGASLFVAALVMLAMEQIFATAPNPRAY